MAKTTRKSRALVTVDPLKLYLQEVMNYPLITAEEEEDLAKRFHEAGDLDAAKKLVAAHLRLVVKIAMEYRNAYNNVLDLIQEGNVGLLQAVKHFDSEKGSRLAHYATWWIRSYILKYILDNFRLIKVGTTKAQKKLFYNLMHEKEHIEAMGYKATPVELSKRLGVDEATVVDMQRRLTTPELALQAPVGGDKGDNASILQDFLPIDEIPVDEKLAQQESQDILKQKFEEFSKELSPRELKIFKERLMSELPVTLQDIADEYGISKERVRQLEEKLIGRIKKYFKAEGIGIDTVGRT